MPQTLTEIAVYPMYLESNIRKVVSKEDHVVMKIEKRCNKANYEKAKKDVDTIILYKTQEFVYGGLNDFWDNLLKEVYGAGK